MRDHWSLVLFTLLVQSAVGGLWCLQAVLLGGISLLDLPLLKYHLYLTLFLACGGLGAAFLHLGLPFNSYYAIRNLKKSWLSREITFVSTLGGALIILIILAQTHPGVLNSWILLIGSMIGGITLYAMTKVYRLKTVPAWNHVGTPLSFLSSTLLLGGLQCTVLLEVQAWHNFGSSGTLAQVTFLKVVFIAFGVAGLACKFLAAGLNATVLSASGTYPARQPILQAGGLAIWMIYILINGNPAWQTILLVLTACALISGETLHRIKFYQSYKRLGL